jgi:hypothetical protein
MVSTPLSESRLSARGSRPARVDHEGQAGHGAGWLTNPRKAAYNRVYNRTTRGCLIIVVFMGLALAASVCSLFSVYAGY